MPLEVSYFIALSGDRGRGMFAQVDEAEMDRLGQHRWHFDGHYPTTNIKRRHVRMHAMVMGRQPGDPGEVDHINGDPLDNRRGNLRVVSHAENGRNRRALPGSTSSHRGVSWDASRGRWKAQARRDYRMHFLGRYETEQEAADAVERFWAQDEAYLHPKLVKAEEATT